MMASLIRKKQKLWMSTNEKVLPNSVGDGSVGFNQKIYMEI